MLHAILRQRRRIAFAVLLAQLASVWQWHSIVMTGLLTFCVLAVSIFIIITAHNMRQSIECGAIGICAASFMPPVLMIPMLIAVSVVVYSVFYTTFLDRLPIRIALHSRKRFDAPFDRTTAWAKIIPGQAHVAAHWTGTMTSALKDEDDDNTLYLRFKNADETMEQVTLTYLSLDPHASASYLIERDGHIDNEEIVMSYKFGDAGHRRTTIVSDMHVGGLPIRLAMLRFFDDVLGDELDSFAKMTACHRKWTFRDIAKVSLTGEMGSQEEIVLGVIPPSEWFLNDFDEIDLIEGAATFEDVPAPKNKAAA